MTTTRLGRPKSPTLHFRDAVWRGLGHTPKRLPSKYFYDAVGSHLFDRICELPEYYPTRTELGILRDHAAAMARAIGPDALVLEYGSGSSVKTRLLLDALESPAAYVPVDISGDYLQGVAASLMLDYPELDVLPVAADFTRPFAVPEPARPEARRVAFFPGSTIGNFTPATAVRLLDDMAQTVGPGGAVLIGIDLRKDPRVLQRAYDDWSGVTALFNRNILARANRELAADFDVSKFRHHAVYNSARGRVEMHLVSTAAQVVRVAGRPFRFAEWEGVRTEYSYKYTPAGFAALAKRAGLAVERSWTDPQRYFAVLLLTCGG